MAREVMLEAPGRLRSVTAKFPDVDEKSGKELNSIFAFTVIGIAVLSVGESILREFRCNIREQGSLSVQLPGFNRCGGQCQVKLVPGCGSWYHHHMDKLL